MHKYEKLFVSGHELSITFFMCTSGKLLSYW